MSLRTEIHAAFDELAPSTFGMPERVMATVLVADPRVQRRRWERPRWRMPLSLVAVLLVIALVVATMVGGRLVADWRAYLQRSVPAGHINETELRVLESRAFHLPALGATADCPAGPFNSVTGWWGTGQVSMSSWTSSGLGGITLSGWGVYIELRIETNPAVKGPILIRAVNVRTGERIAFVGRYTAGPITGTDTVSGRADQQFGEVALDADHPPAGKLSGYVAWDSIEAGVHVSLADWQRHDAAAAICIGWQADGVGFSENFYTPF